MEVMSVIGLVVTYTSGVYWLVRLEGRINTQERLHKELRDDVKYIVSRIDAALNNRR